MTENYNAKNWTLHNCINSGKIRSEGWVYFLKFSNGKVYVYFAYIHICLLLSSFRFLYWMSANILEKHFGNMLLSLKYH